MPWKNGLGVTTEVAIFPPAAKFADEDFLWRISVSEVRADGPFSIFKGYDRLLAVWKGAGLYLGEKHLAPMSPLHFAGDALTDCKLIDGDIVDLGVIFRRQDIQAEMKVVDSNSIHSEVQKPNRVHFLFCVNETKTKHGILQPGDVLQFESSESFSETIFAFTKQALLISLANKTA